VRVPVFGSATFSVRRVNFGGEPGRFRAASTLVLPTGEFHICRCAKPTTYSKPSVMPAVPRHGGGTDPLGLQVLFKHDLLLFGTCCTRAGVRFPYQALWAVVPGAGTGWTRRESPRTCIPIPPTGRPGRRCWAERLVWKIQDSGSLPPPPGRCVHCAINRHEHRVLPVSF